MKKDIQIPVVKDVYLAIVHEWNAEFLSKDWNAYIINDKIMKLDMVLVVSKGFDDTLKTSTMRHAIEVVKPKSFEKIEVIQEDVLALNNEFFVTFYADNKLHEKRFLFKKGSVTESNLKLISSIEKDGVLAE